MNALAKAVDFLLALEETSHPDPSVVLRVQGLRDALKAEFDSADAPNVVHVLPAETDAPAAAATETAATDTPAADDTDPASNEAAD